MAEKTESPTPRRLQESRQEGTVALSQELNAAAALLVGTWLLSGPGRVMVSDLQELIIQSITNLPIGEVSNTWLIDLLVNDGIKIGSSLLMIILGMMVAGVTVTVCQTGFLWAGKRIRFDFGKLNPLNGFKRMFSSQGLFEWVKAMLKLVVVTWAAYSYLKGNMNQLIGLSYTDIKSALAWWSEIAIDLSMRVATAYLLLAIADYVYQRWTLRKSLMMSREEIREEAKRSEGDPMIKNRIRGQARRMARLRMIANVPKADVVITNPTHLAIAIQYDQNNMNAPIVLAKGAHLLAERIVGIARSNGIPVMQNIPLARAIYKVVEINQEIPPELYVAMAEVLAHVFALRGRATAQAAA